MFTLPFVKIHHAFHVGKRPHYTMRRLPIWHQLAQSRVLTLCRFIRSLWMKRHSTPFYTFTYLLGSPMAKEHPLTVKSRGL